MNVFAAGGEAEGSAILIPAVYDLIWGGLSFLIVLVLFWKFVLPAMQKVMAERTDKIEGGIQRAEAMQVEAAQALQEYRAQLAEAREEAAAVRTQAQADRKAIIDEARAEAAAAASQVASTAAANLERERTQIMSQLTQQVGSVAVELAGKVVGQTLSDDARVRETVDAFIADLERQAAR